MVSSKIKANATLNNVTRLIALIIFLGVIVYIYFLSSSEDSSDIKEKLSQLSFSSFIIPIALSLISYLLRFIRWRLILKKLGHRLSVKNDFICYLSGFALTMTPGKSGETIRSAFLLQSKVPVLSSLSAFIIERSFDLLVVGLLASLMFIPTYMTLLLLLSALIMIPLVVTYLASHDYLYLKKYLPSFFMRLVDIFSKSSVALKFQSVVIYVLFGFSAWGAQAVGFYYVVCLFTQDIELFNAISTYCAGIFIGAASMIPGGIGITEGSLSWLLQTQGLDQNSAILSALISRGCTLWLAVAIGCSALAAIIHGQTLPSPKTIPK